MFWFTFALFVGSFILSYALAPKPDIEDARPANITNFQYPRASAGSPIPVLYGRMEMPSPNTIWMGTVDNFAITQNVQTGWFSEEEQITGFGYLIAIDLALCLGPDVKLAGILFDNKVRTIFSPPVAHGDISIRNSSPAIEGEDEEWSDTWDSMMESYETMFPTVFYDGAFDQHTDPSVVSMVGTPEIPAYRGVAHVVFSRMSLGTSAYIPPISFDTLRYPNTLAQPEIIQLIGNDLNPMEVLYAMFTEAWGGMGLAASNFDVASFVYAAEVLAEEENGMSLMVDTVNQIKSLTQEVLRQADGVLYQEPTTGAITMKLIRNDYEIETLPLLTPSSVVSVENFTCSSWGETYNQVRVTYLRRRGSIYVEDTVLAQDFSNIAMQGKVRSTTLSFPGVHTKELAQKIASRELAYLTVPLCRATLMVNRTAAQLRPGSPFRLTWPEYGLDEAVFRVQRFNLNELINGRISMEIVRDRFAMGDVLLGAEDTLSTGSDRPAISVSESLVFESPYWLVNQVNDLDKPADSTWLWFFAKPGGYAQIYYSARTSYDNFVTSPGGVRELDKVPYPPHATLVGNVYAMMGMANGTLSELTIEGTFPSSLSVTQTATTGEIQNSGKNILIIGNEILANEGVVDNEDGTFTLTNVHRALLDTAPEDHLEGATVYLVGGQLSAYVAGLTWFSRTAHDDADQLWYRFVSSSDNSVEAEEDSVIHTLTPAQRYTRPLPPDMTEVESMRIATDIIITTTTLNISGWYTRNRTTPNQVVLYTDSEDAAETGTTFQFDFYVDDILVTATTGVAIAAVSTTMTVRGKGFARLESWAAMVSGTRRSHAPDIVEFFFAYYPNLSATLLANGTFESTGTTGWTVDSGAWARTTTAYPLNTIKPGTYHIQSTQAGSKLSQVVDIISPTDYRGKAAVMRVLKGGAANVMSQMIVELLDASDAVLDSVSTPLSAPEAIGKWELLEVAMPILSTGAKLKMRLEASGVGAVFDNAAIRVNTLSPTTATKYDALTGITPRGAWGLRTLISTYSGPLVRIRDTYDDAEQDVYADTDGNLSAFFTVGQARVVTLYDQSASATNLTATVAKQPLLKTHISATGRAAIEFDAEPCSLFDGTAGTTRPYMVTRPNMSLVIGPKWNTGTSHFIAGVSHMDASHTTPYYRCGLRCGNTNWTYNFNATQTAIAGAGSCAVLFSVWWLDYQNGNIYHNNDVTATSTFTPEDITYPNSTRLRLAESAEEIQNWEGYFFELCVFEGNISAGDRQTLMESIGLYWHNLAV